MYAAQPHCSYNLDSSQITKLTVEIHQYLSRDCSDSRSISVIKGAILIHQN